MSITTGGRGNGSMGSRANTSIGARANASVAPQPDILFGRGNGSMGSRANTSIGARANASVAPQPDILFGIRADGSGGARTDISNGDHQSNDSQSYAGSEGSWANDGMKAKWLSDLLNGYFGNSKASVTDCSPKEKCATVEQNSVYLRLEREKFIEEIKSTHNTREGDGNATNVNGNNSRKDIVQPAKNSEQKRRKSQKTKECPSEDVNDEVLDNDAPIDESRRHMSSRLSEKVNKNFNEEIPVANRSRQVVHSLRDNTANNTGLPRPRPPPTLAFLFGVFFLSSTFRLGVFVDNTVKNPFNLPCVEVPLAFIIFSHRFEYVPR
ncbi:hypothetical protein QE152_g32313 [Popillia japonica]|uniref:Uncharacterized protein n=1 Tax=Popillia japonica TaxID=7064 RepID=A0AAW1J055_POPJA